MLENTEESIKIWKIQRNWQHCVENTKKNKTKIQHNTCCAPLCANKQTTII